MNKLIVSSIAAACLFGTATANAEEVKVRVSHADLDLTRSGDVAKLRTRMRIAIHNACSQWPGNYSWTSASACFTEAMADADAQIRALRAPAASAVVARN